MEEEERDGPQTPASRRRLSQFRPPAVVAAIIVKGMETQVGVLASEVNTIFETGSQQNDVACHVRVC